METLVVLAIVVLGAAAFVGLGVFLASRGEPERISRTMRPRKSWPRILGGLLLAVLGCLVALVSYVSTVHLCDVPPFEDSWPLESRGNAVAMTSAVLEVESATGGLGSELLMRILGRSQSVIREQRAGPAGLNSVRLGSSPLAQWKRVGVLLGLRPGVPAAQGQYSNSTPPRRSRRVGGPGAAGGSTVGRGRITGRRPNPARLSQHTTVGVRMRRSGRPSS